MFCYFTEYVNYRDELTKEWKEKENEILINTDLISLARDSEEHEGRMILSLSGVIFVEVKGTTKELYDFINEEKETRWDYV